MIDRENVALSTMLNYSKEGSECLKIFFSACTKVSSNIML